MKIFNKLCMLFLGLLAMSSLNAQTELIKGGLFRSSDISQWTLGVNANGQSGTAAFGNTVDLPTGSVSTTSVKLTHNGVGTPEVQLYQRVRLLAGQVYKLSAKVRVSGVMSNRALQVYIAKDSTPDNGTMFSDAIMNTGIRSKSAALFLEGWPFAGNTGTVNLNGAFPISTVGPGTDLIAPDESGDYLILIKMGQWGPTDPFSAVISDLSLTTVASSGIAVTGVALPPAVYLAAVGATTTLVANVIPNNATNKAVTWSSSNPAIATVSSTGLVTAVARGNATVTVTTQDGSKTASTLINITPSSFRLVWQDEFNGTGLPDSTKWGYETGYIRNNELQYYTKSINNARQNQGNLEIVLRKEPTNGYDYSSASLITKNKAQAQLAYGKIDARMKLPSGQGLWTAFWTLGTNYDQVFWPRCGEIDIIERINSETFVHSTAHWGDTTNTRVSRGGQSGTIDPSQWHNYTIEWTPTSIKWFVDSVQHHSVTITNAVNYTYAFHLPHYVLLNLVIGGTWPGAPNASTPLPATLYCDYLRLYEWVPESPLAVTHLAMSASNVTTTVGGSIQVSPVFVPYNAGNKTLTWQSSDNTIATVNASGLITGVRVGTATITAKTTDGGNVTASTAVNVISAGNLNFVLNPSFELDNAEVQKPLNWSEWSPKTPSSVDSAKVVRGNAQAGSYYGLMTGRASYASMMFQTIKNLPIGLYTLKGWFRSSGGQPYSIMSIKNHGGGEITRSLGGSMANWTQLSIDTVTISTGQCEIDIYNDANANQWIEFDNIQLSLKTTGLKEIKDGLISIYPNPVVDKAFNITNEGFENGTVTISNITGQVVYSNKLPIGNTSMNVSFLNSGIYLVHITNGTEYHLQKLIIP